MLGLVRTHEIEDQVSSSIADSPPPVPPALAWAVRSYVIDQRDEIIRQEQRERGVTEPEAASNFQNLCDALQAFPHALPASSGQVVPTEVCGGSDGLWGVERPYGRLLLLLSAASSTETLLLIPLTLISAGNSLVVSFVGARSGLAALLIQLICRVVPNHVSLWNDPLISSFKVLNTCFPVDAVCIAEKACIATKIRLDLAKSGIPIIYDCAYDGIGIVDDSVSLTALRELGETLACSIHDEHDPSYPKILAVSDRQISQIETGFRDAAHRLSRETSVDKLSRGRPEVRLTYRSISLSAGHNPSGGPELFKVPDLDYATSAVRPDNTVFVYVYRSMASIINILAAYRRELALWIYSSNPTTIRNLVSKTRFRRYILRSSIGDPKDLPKLVERPIECEIGKIFAAARYTAVIDRLHPDKALSSTVLRSSSKVRPLRRKLFLWGHPRSRSTALERSFLERDDTVVLHEPLSKFAYFGDDIRDVIEAIENDETAINSSILEDVRYCPQNPNNLLIKDFPYHALPYLSDRLLRQFRHIVIVRNPGATIRSLRRVQPEFKDNEVGFDELLALGRRLREGLELPVLLVDADGLARDPEKVLRKICNFAEIPYDQKMLNWQQRGEIPAWKLWDGFHDHALASLSIGNHVSDEDSSLLADHDARLAARLQSIYLNIIDLLM